MCLKETSDSHFLCQWAASLCGNPNRLAPRKVIFIKSSWQNILTHRPVSEVGHYKSRSPFCFQASTAPLGRQATSFRLWTVQVLCRASWFKCSWCLKTMLDFFPKLLSPIGTTMIKNNLKSNLIKLSDLTGINLILVTFTLLSCWTVFIIPSHSSEGGCCCCHFPQLVTAAVWHRGEP